MNAFPLYHALSVLCLSLLLGCASNAPGLSGATRSAAIPPAVELRDTPFFPQQEYQCGPAALATTLAASGVAVTPAELIDKVYLPQREGSLQLELVAASRRYDRLPYVLDGELVAILAEVAAGRPVLVLQNLGVASFPLWHYAVVVGYDAAQNEMVLRSGTQRRDIMTAGSFLRSWELGGRWALVVLPPGGLPVNPDEHRYLDAVVALEGVAAPAAIAPFYAAAAQRWPGSALALLGLANSYYAMGRMGDAEQTLRQLLAAHPDDAAARNNLAHILALRGCTAVALSQLKLGLAALPPDHPLRGQLQQTRDEILASPKELDGGDCSGAAVP